MAKKSFAKRVFTGRWVRWKIIYLVLLPFPGLRRLFNFPIEIATLDSGNARVLTESASTVRLDVSKPVHALVLHTQGNVDAGDTSRYREGESILRTRLLVVQDTIVMGHTMAQVCASDFRLIRDAHLKLNWWNRAKPRVLRSRPAEGHLFWVLPATKNYYHFIADDILPVIGFMRQFPGELRGLTFIVSANLPDFARALLSAVCQEFEANIKTVEPGERLRLRSSVVHHMVADNLEWMPVDRRDLEVLTRCLDRFYDLERGANRRRRLYLSRRGAKLRNVVNEDALLDALAPFGFEPFVADANNHAQQINAFREVEVVISPHGAGLTNIIFSNPGTRVIELFPRDHVKSTYAWIASQLGHDYRAIIGGPSGAHERFSVAVNDLLKEVA